MNLFITITNANFDNEAIISRIRETLTAKEELLKEVKDKEALPQAAFWNGSEEEFESKAKEVGVDVYKRQAARCELGQNCSLNGILEEENLI